jgi:SH3-like domain-containing protein
MSSGWTGAALAALMAFVGETAPTGADAQTVESAAAAPSAPAAAPRRLGPETKLPLPRYVSLNVEKANIRRGPGLSHRIDWVFMHRGQPLEVVAEHGHWRKVRDADDAGGWIHHTMLRGFRTAVVTAAPDAALRADPAPDAPLVARAETGALGSVDACGPLWCHFEADGIEGWIQKADVWGVGPDEVFD